MLLEDDILMMIATHLDPEDILGRLELSSEQVVTIFAPFIMKNLQAFDDVYGEHDFEEEDDG